MPAAAASSPLPKAGGARGLRSVLRAPRAGGSGAELWRWPTLAAVAGMGLGLGLTELLPAGPRGFAWPGDVAAAQALLQAVSSAAVTILALAFSLTIIALQLASQQFSPRLLRGFMRDRVTKVVLGVLVSVFAYCLTTLRRLDAEKEVPGPAMLVALLGGLALLFAVLAFIHHLARQLRVETMMTSLHKDTSDAIQTFYDDHDATGALGPDVVEHGIDPRHGSLVLAEANGFVRLVDVSGLLQAAQRLDLVVRVDVRPGDHVVSGNPVASVWGRGGGEVDEHAVAQAVRGALVLSYERTVEQDAAFGFRQLEDIAVKALSPGINDPATAVHAIGHMSALLVELCGRRLGPTAHRDAEGVARLIVPDRDLRYYLDLAVGQVRRYGAHEPTVQVALLRMLRDTAAAARDDEQRAEVERQVRVIVEHLPEDLSAHDAGPVHDLADRVRQALAHDLRAAYFDRTGETRSL